MLRTAFIAVLVGLLTTGANADLAPFSDAQLARQLPDSTLVYVRVPHLAGLLATAKDNALDPVLSNPDRAQAADRIVAAALARLGAINPEEAEPIVRLINDIRSPVEIAVVATPGPVAIVSMALPERDRAGFERWFARLSAMGPPGALSLVPENDALYRVDGVPAPVFAGFDAASGRVNLLLGQALDLPAAERTLGGLDGSGNIPGEVAAIDTSGQGLLLWANVERSLPMAQLFIPPEQYALLEQLGIETMRAIQLGIGVADGQSRMSLRATLLPDAERKLPVIQHELGAKAAGSLETLVQFGIPSQSDWQRLEGIVEQNLEGQAWTDWQYGRTQLTNAYALDFDLLTRAFGPDLSFLVDSAGEYFAMRIRDPGAYRQWIALLQAATHIEYRRERVGRQQFHEIVITDPEIPAVEPGESADPIDARLQALIRDIKTRIYWIEEDGYLYLSSLPQGMMARGQERKRVKVGDWLGEQRGTDLSSAVFGASWNSRHLPRRLYDGYLTTMQLLADVGQTPFNIYDMPSASALDLPVESTMGLALNLGQDAIGFELISESSPLDFIIGGNTAASVAVVGILAAVAIPAYEDYTRRAEVAADISRATELKGALLDFHAEAGRMPNDDEAATLAELVGADYMGIAADTGVIEIYQEATLRDDLEYGLVLLEPYVEGGQIVDWTCSGTIEQKYLPAQCRDNVVPEAYR